jgi:hypothetical protein
MQPFIYPVPTVEAAKLLCDALARYDLFQYENKVKPDYSNAGGASWRHPELTGGEWYDFDPGEEGDLRWVTACGPHASQPVQSWWPSSQLRSDSPFCSTIRARARAFSSMIRTPVGQTSLQTRQPEQ